MTNSMDSAATRRELRRAGLLTCCREVDEDGERCAAPAEFILWGKLIPADGLGPRCYDHAAKHVGAYALGDPSWAIADLRPLTRQLAGATEVSSAGAGS